MMFFGKNRNDDDAPLCDMRPTAITAETIEEGAAIARQKTEAYWLRVQDLQTGKIELSWNPHEGYYYRYKDRTEDNPWRFWGYWL